MHGVVITELVRFPTQRLYRQSSDGILKTPDLQDTTLGKSTVENNEFTAVGAVGVEKLFE